MFLLRECSPMPTTRRRAPGTTSGTRDSRPTKMPRHHRTIGFEPTSTCGGDTRRSASARNGCGRGGFSVWLARAAKPLEQVAMDSSPSPSRRGASSRGGWASPRSRGRSATSRPSHAVMDRSTPSSRRRRNRARPRSGARGARARAGAQAGRPPVPNDAELREPDRCLPRVHEVDRAKVHGGRSTDQPADAPAAHDRLGHARRAPRRSGERDRSLRPVSEARPIHVPILDGVRPITRWLGLHSLVVATKP